RTTEGQRLGDVALLDRVHLLEVRQRAGYPANAVVPACRQPGPVDRPSQKPARLAIDRLSVELRSGEIPVECPRSACRLRAASTRGATADVGSPVGPCSSSALSRRTATRRSKRSSNGPEIRRRYRRSVAG